jgi:hypothetical protein
MMKAAKGIILTGLFLGLLLGLLLGLFLLSGCGDDDSTCVNCPIFRLAPDATLENIWPNADSTSWDYSFVRRQWGDSDDIVMYENKEDVPDAPTPSWTTIRDILSEDPISQDDTVTTILGNYYLAFDGVVQAGGQTVQKLLRTHVLEDTVTIPSHAARSGHNLLPVRFRSDAAPYMGNPIFIQGGAWLKTDDEIVKFGDLGQLPMWQFLTDQLSPGDEFTFQLAVGIADDIYLHCRVDRVLTVETQAGTFKKATDCLYILDYGVSRASTPQGETLGYFRNVDAGRVIYAPTVGPVYCYERLLIQPGEPDLRGLFDVTVDLIDSSTLED